MNSATILIVIPAVIGVAFLLDKALTRVVHRKYERLLYRQYYKGVSDTKHEQRATIEQLRQRIYRLEDQARRLRQPASNGVRP